MSMSDLRAAIQAEMQAAFPVAEARVLPFYGMQEYHLGWRDSDLRPTSADPGKLLRPLLALLAAQAVGGTLTHAMPLAAGIQLIHDFSLIHDDIEDNSDLRRGRVTLWTRWGLAQGLNAGDGMFVLAHLALHRMSAAGVPAERVLTVLQRFDETILTICEGQYLDISFEGNLAISEADYLAMIGRKTAALIAASASLGALACGAEAATVEAFAAFGRGLGLAFQIEDDILGIWGEPEVTGKPRAADLYRRKVSLPVIRALRSPHGAAMAPIYQQGAPTDDDVRRALELLAAAEARAYCVAEARQHHLAALAALDRVRPGAAPEAHAALGQIRAIAESLLGRQA